MDAPAKQKEVVTFSFGKNWEQFVEQSFSRERVEIARKHILDFLRLPDLGGKHFLDIGCGSGLSSLAAFDSKAAKIVSFDLDPASVRTTERLKAMRGDPENWLVLQGSVLDPDFLSTLDAADIVYSWGVLHHTGEMWRAVENAARLVKPGGLFYVALYTTTPFSPYWIGVKKKYNQASAFGKRWMEARYVARHTFLPLLLRFKNPLTPIREYKKNRGMSFMTDVRDWLGGYPYEDARIEEVLRFGREKLGLELVNLATGQANTEYLFTRPNERR